MTGTHVIKYKHEDGKKLITPIVWCGSDHDGGWMFEGAQHVLLSGGLMDPCKDCIRAIIWQLEKEL